MRLTLLGTTNTFNVTGLTIHERLGYGRFSAMGRATFDEQDAFIKCSYHLPSIKLEQEVYRYDRYFADVLHKFKVNLPYKMSRWLARYLPISLPRFVTSAPLGQCLITKYIEGKPLDRFFEGREDKERDAFTLIYQLLRVLRFLNKYGIAYNDIKPADIIVTENKRGRPLQLKLIDFDTVTLFNAKVDVAPVGRYTGSVLEYRPPETLWNRDYSLLRGQTWSVGTMFYHILAKRLITGPSVGEDGRFDRGTFKKELGTVLLADYFLPPVAMHANSDRRFSDDLTCLLNTLLTPYKVEEHKDDMYLGRYPVIRYTPREFLRHYPSVKALPPLEI
ncbi:kinase-like domain-containing protein [Syncephalis pseudoplumigaleata]|uniref:Kinase-like domain-containing protein n=1 Tax=Syncephalis pseudoplumigaleata TaxID=1712513 RepID=A0A4P9Z5R1_9FUNG|nr:kinase-like domain-containing protein [Syncephalis pseudoplumigaleata]|eukprot:RKP27808.1 kinase-like domain-containing protein [Syncephalis pseudoplumigaleata]